MTDTQLRKLFVTPADIEEAPARPPTQILDHELICRIGRGAYGEVWLASNAVGTLRAVKIVYRNSFASNAPYEREYHGIQKFEPISRSSDGFVDILQIGRNEAQGYFYYVMELADDADDRAARNAESTPALSAGAPPAPTTEERGKSPLAGLTNLRVYAPKTLRSEIQRCGRLPFEQCLHFAMTLNLALGQLHRHGLIHRDIKPSNLIFVNGVPKLADIGLVTEVDEARSFVGTEGFVPPEGPNSPRADIYSLGKVIYEMSMGKDRMDFPEPFTALGQAPESLQLEELNAVILKACALDPRDRYQSAEEMNVDLALLQSGRSVKSKQLLERRLSFARKAGAVVAVMAVLVTAGFVSQRYQTREAKRLQRIAEDLASQMQMQNAENLFARGDSPLALAHLAHVLRRDPDNRAAAERISAALAQRHFPRLLTKPMLHDARLILRHTQVPARLSPDGSRILSTSSDHTVHVWQTETGEETIPALRYLEPVTAIDFSPDSSMAVAASGDRTATVFDLQTGSPAFPPMRHDRTVLSAAFDRTGRVIATASLDSHARLFSAETGQLLHAPLPHDGGVNAVAFSPDSQWLATASEDATVRVWEVQSGELRHRIRHTGPVRLVRFSPDGIWIAAVVFDREADMPSQDWKIQIHDVASGIAVGDPLIHNRVYSIAFSPDSQRLVVGDGANVTRVWQISSSEERFRLQHSAIVHAAEFSPDGRQILTGSGDGQARLWDASTGEAIAEPMLHSGRVIHVEFNRDGGRVLTVGWEDHALKLWAVPPKAPVHRTFAHPMGVNVAAFDTSGRHFFTTTRASISTANDINRARDEQESLMVWALEDDRPKFAATFPKGIVIAAAHISGANARALLRDRVSSEARLWDSAQGVMVGEVIRHEASITSARFSQDGLKLATGATDGTARIWDSQGHPLTLPMVHAGQVTRVVFSPDSKQLLAVSQETATIWDASNGTRLGTLSGHTAPIWTVRFSFQNDKVVTASQDNSARIWSTNGTLLATLQHGAPVEYAEFSPDGTMVVTAAGDRTARVWSGSSGRQLIEPLEHKELVFMARFSPDGLRIVTASMDRTAQLWDSATGLRLADPFRHGDWVICAHFAPDGRQVVTASQDRMARTWEVPVVLEPIPSWLPALAEAVGGQRLNADRIPEPVSWTVSVELENQLARSVEETSQYEWARPFVSWASAAR